MRVLLVEDEESTIRQIRSRLETACQGELDVARSRDTALEILNSEKDFDLIVCDLRIPTRDDSLDVAEEHGLRVHDVAREKHSGTFCVFFSGYVQLENVGVKLSTGPSVDVFGTGQILPLVEAHPKSNQPEFINSATELSGMLDDLERIKVTDSGTCFTNEFEARPLRIYAKRLSGTRIVVSQLGGLSGAKVLRFEIIDAAGATVGSLVAKVDLLARIKDELARYQQHVAPILGIGTFAPLAGDVSHGCGRFGAAFYTLAENGYQDLFNVSISDVATSLTAVNHLRDSHSQWKGISVSTNQSVGTIRSSYISDEQFAPWRCKLGHDRVEQVEKITIPVKNSVQHGDLHGLNVLVDTEGRPLIIDYGNLGQHPAAIDPITLELSFVFHPNHPKLYGWPNVEQAACWFDLTDYTRGSRLREVVNACREWSLSTTTEKQLAGVVYAHAVRQLKYEETNKPLALAIAKAATTVLIDE